MKQLFLLILPLALMCAAPVVRADEAADQDAIKSLEKRCAAALVSGDFKVLESIFSEGWLLVVADGHTMTRDEVLADLHAGNLKFTSYELGEIEVRLFGNTAIAVGHGHPHGELRGEKFVENEVFSDTFVRQNGQWHCILSHSSESPE
jgi:ketosteroid isomerase-like protein